MSNNISVLRDEAYRIITALRKGTPPEEGIDLYSVGREDLLKYFSKKLDEIRNYDAADVKLVQADWGQGKSHFLALLRNLALQKNFVSSEVQLHSKEAPFDQLAVVIQRMIANMMTPQARENGLERLLQQWAEVNKGKSEQEIFTGLRALPLPDMRLKLVEYFRAYNQQSGPAYQQCLQTLRWFRGEETKSRTFINVKEYLHALTNFIRSLGYSGLIVLMDEAEAITSLSRIARRDLANENIRQIIDNDRDTKGFYFILASTPTFLSGEFERGAQSYPALWRRISNPLATFQTSSLENVIVDLPRLTEKKFFELARKIKHIYEAAAGRNIRTVTNERLETLAKYVQQRTDQRVGTMVRSVVAVLDSATTKGFDFAANFELIVEGVMHQEEVDRAE